MVGGSDGDQVLRSAEIYDPGQRRFAPAGLLRASRHKHAAVRLPSGDVLVAGGGESVERGGPGGRFVRVGAVGGPFSFATATLTAAGGVLVAGDYDHSIVPTADAWIFSP